MGQVVPSTYIQDLMQLSCQLSEASVVPPQLTDLNTEGRERVRLGCSDILDRKLEGFGESWTSRIGGESESRGVDQGQGSCIFQMHPR